MDKIIANGIIHYSHWASQPDVLIACGLEADTWTILYPEQQRLYGNPLAHGYTFTESEVTCTDCIKYMEDNHCGH